MEFDNVNFNKKVCRTCLTVDNEDYFCDLFTSNESFDENLSSLPDMITECTNYSVKKDDNYPNGICYKCLDALKISYNFKKQCEKSFETLKSILEKCKKTEKHFVDALYINELKIRAESATTQTDVLLLYPCEKCEEKFFTFDKLEEHIKKYHDEKKCRVCSKIFVHTPKTTLSSEGEPTEETNKENNDYLQIVDNNDICETCNNFYSETNDFNNLTDENNKDGCDIPWQYICAACSQTFTSEESLKNHECDNNGDLSIKVDSTVNRKTYTDENNLHIKSEDCKLLEINDNSETESFIGDTDDLQDDDDDDDTTIEEDNPLEVVENLKKEQENDNNLLIEIKSEQTDDYTEEDDDNIVNEKNNHSKKYKKTGNNKRKKPKCDVCNKIFSRSTHLKRHLLTHTNEKPYTCKVCNKGFTRSDHLNVHMHHHSDTKPYNCDICERGFTRAEHLRKHKDSRHGHKVKTPKTEFCEICKKGFTTTKYLHIHMRIHTDRIWNCKSCPEKFKTKPELTAHSKTHAANEKPFLCSECGLRFVRNDYLVIHMRRHKGEKPYKCKFCGKGFPRATDLTVHERYHTGEKTHLCTICGKGFQRAYNLLVHMRVHTGERPYECPHCSKRFAQGNDLKAHIRRHTGERFKCDICGDGFIQGYHLTQHKRNIHGIDMKSHIRRVEKYVTPMEQQKQMEALKNQLQEEIIQKSESEHDNNHSNQTDDDDNDKNNLSPTLTQVEIIKIEEDNIDVTEAISLSVEQAEMLERGQEITVMDGNNIAMISYFTPPKSKVKYE